jgi:hypothetical protein
MINQIHTRKKCIQKEIYIDYIKYNMDIFSSYIYNFKKTKRTVIS